MNQRMSSQKGGRIGRTMVSVRSLSPARPAIWPEGEVPHANETMVCFSGLPGGTRTPDLLLRRQLLYPVELRVGKNGMSLAKNTQKKRPTNGPFLRGGRSGGIRTRDPLLPKQMRYQAALRSDETVL